MTDYPTPRHGLNGDELASVTDTVADRLRSIVDRLDHETWTLGMSWYGNANAYARTLSAEYDVPYEYAAGIIAALSPRVSWADNLKGADSILADGEQASTMALGVNVVKALWIENGSDPDSILGGRKVRSFWRNISQPYSSLDVTLDGHMVNALGLPSHRYLERKGVYDAIADAFRTVAEEHGILPHQLQAAVWIHVRGDAE